MAGGILACLLAWTFVLPAINVHLFHLFYTSSVRRTTNRGEVVVLQEEANVVHGSAVLPLLAIFLLLLLSDATVGALPRERKYDRNVGSMLVVWCLACLTFIVWLMEGFKLVLRCS